MAKFPPARVTIHVVRPSGERCVVVTPIVVPDLEASVVRSLDAARSAIVQKLVDERRGKQLCLT